MNCSDERDGRIRRCGTRPTVGPLTPGSKRAPVLRTARSLRAAVSASLQQPGGKLPFADYGHWAVFTEHGSSDVGRSVVATRVGTSAERSTRLSRCGAVQTVG